MNLENYLARIGYSGKLRPDYPTLRGLHLAHFLAVPFENLDIHAGRKIVIGADNAYRKLVEEKRGGFCYEQNGLFGAVLAEIGFGVTYLSGRVARRTGGWGPEFDHLALLVDVPEDEPYLADVGFGESFREPLRWNDTGPQRQGANEYRLAETLEGRVLSSRSLDGEWSDRFILSVTPRSLTDFAAMCEFHQTSPESHFTREPMISLAQPDGRTTLTGQQLILTRQGVRNEQAVADRAAFFENLEQHFGVVLSPEMRKFLAAKVWPEPV